MEEIQKTKLETQEQELTPFWSLELCCHALAPDFL